MVSPNRMPSRSSMMVRLFLGLESEHEAGGVVVVTAAPQPAGGSPSFGWPMRGVVWPHCRIRIMQMAEAVQGLLRAGAVPQPECSSIPVTTQDCV